MLKDSTATRISIRVTIFCLRAIAPCSILYCCARLVGWSVLPSNPIVELLLDIYATCESLLYLALYLPRKHFLGLPAPVREPLPVEKRKELHVRAWEATFDVRTYLSQWFYGAPVESIGREDVKDFVLWRLWNKTERHPDDEVELEEHLNYIERVVGHKFVPGRTGVESMMVTFEPLRMLHRPLFWYLFLIGGVELHTWIMMLYYGFKHYRVSLSTLVTSFPFRWPALLSSYRSPVDGISYWYLPHKNNDTIPVLFIHAIGIGLNPYLGFFKEFIDLNLDTGIIAIEILPVSSRICMSPILDSSEMAEQISSILQHHGWSRCVLVTHSYGSIAASNLLQNPHTTNLIDHCIFVDPVTFSFHAPAVAYNFLRRRPQTASEIELYYFVCTDPDIVRALTRSFTWPESSLWREDVENRRSMSGGRQLKTTLLICGRDIITDTLTLGRYMTRKPRRKVKWYQEKAPTSDKDNWKDQRWTGDLPIEVVWYPELNHAEIFDEAEDRAPLLKVLKTYVMDSKET